MWEGNVIKMVVLRQLECFLFLQQEILNVSVLCFYNLLAYLPVPCTHPLYVPFQLPDPGAGIQQPPGDLLESDPIGLSYLGKSPSITPGAHLMTDHSTASPHFLGALEVPGPGLQQE